MTEMDQTEYVGYVEIRGKNIIDLYHENDDKVPFKCKRSYWKRGNFFVVKEVNVPHYTDGTVIFSEITVKGDFYQQGKIKDKNHRLSQMSWEPREWDFVTIGKRKKGT